MVEVTFKKRRKLRKERRRKEGMWVWVDGFGGSSGNSPLPVSDPHQWHAPCRSNMLTACCMPHAACYLLHATCYCLLY